MSADVLPLAPHHVRAYSSSSAGIWTPERLLIDVLPHVRRVARAVATR